MMEERIQELVKEHYGPGGSSGVLLLSSLGFALKDRGYWPDPSDSRTLNDIAESTPGVTVVRDKEAPAFIPVVIEGEEASAQEAISDHKRRLFLRTLPRALLLAFTLEIANGQYMSVQLEPRVAYRGGPQIDEGWLPVEGEYRRSQLDIRNLKEFSPAQVEDLVGAVRSWCAARNIAPESIVRKQAEWARRSREVHDETPSGVAKSSALERLFAAQDPEIAKRLAIPMDIALALSRMP
jgi:hypothetical protein